MKSTRAILISLFASCMLGCIGIEDDAMYEDEVLGEVESGILNEAGDREAPVEIMAARPSLSSICSRRCNNSHGQNNCSDYRVSGQVNVSVFPLIEGTSVVPSSILGTTTGWADTSCPNCQWKLDGVTTTSLFGGTAPSVSQAMNDVNVSKSVSSSREYDWSGVVAITIWDPTDSSVGTCTLNVSTSLAGGQLF